MNKLTELTNIENVRVEQFHNKNQFLIDLGSIVCLQSYNSLVAVYDCYYGNLYLGKDWDYSNTTRKHIYMFIAEYYPNLWSFLSEKKNKRLALEKCLNDDCIYEVNKLED